jgi:dTDP-4-dehydrorhamnose reductase
MDSDPEQAIFLNALLPHQLAKTCAALDIKMISITSDCVFAGKSGSYTESSPHDPLDAYGKSKSLGETKDCMVIRTSIIGEEIHKNASLVEWVKSQAGKSVNGFTNHYWNGITTKQFASVCHQILEKNLYENGLFHVHSDTVCKADLVEMINQKFNLGISINRIETPESVDRTMTTERTLLSKLDVPSLAQQIKDM